MQSAMLSTLPYKVQPADMIKLAMIRIHQAMKEEKLQSKMVLQVHDELVFDAHRDEIAILKPLIIFERIATSYGIC